LKGAKICLKKRLDTVASGGREGACPACVFMSCMA
jgi:hypothetical protein